MYYYDRFPIEKRLQVVRDVHDFLPVFLEDYKKAKARRTNSNFFREYPYLERYRGLIMPKGTKSNDFKSNPKRSKSTCRWANIKLEEADIEQIEEKLEDPHQLLGELFAVFASGFDVFIKRRDEGQTVHISIISQRALLGDNTVGLSAFAPDLETALSALLYKFFEVCDGKPEQHVSERSLGIG